jgi:uncharacterized membrane protein
LTLVSALSTVSSLSFILQLATAIAAGATGATALKGYRATDSPTLLRLFASFTFLGLGLLLQAVSMIEGDQVISVSILVIGSALDVIGYFLLALSHFFTVRSEIPTVGTLLFLPAVSVPSLISLDLFVNAASLYLLLYISVETLIFFFQNRNSKTLISIIGLLLITVGVLLQMLSPSAADLAVVLNALRLGGFLILFSPVAILFIHRQEVPAG